MGQNTDDMPPFVAGSETSREAAESIRDLVAPLEARCFEMICLFTRDRGDGMTDKELEVAMILSHESASARRRGLVKKGLVRDSGAKKKNRSGRRAVLWVPGNQETITDSTGNRKVRLPSHADLQFTVDFLGGLGKTSPEVGRVLDWLRFLAHEGD